MHAVLVAAGIFTSRVLGFVREALKAMYFGASGSIVADAFSAAFRIPNLLQNLFGEGALSASFIPVYSNLLARGKREDADRVAGAVATLLGLVTAVLVLLGVLGAPLLVSVIASGFAGERRELTIQLTRILFPGAALLVYSAWCLGVLNSHRRFFLSYAAPVAWNGVMIAVLFVSRADAPALLAVKVAWASVVGAALQTLVQLPTVLSVAKSVRIGAMQFDASVREVVRNFVPAFFSRGVVQVSSYIDQLIASLLPVGSVALLGYGQAITLLPISLFGMSISASELPEMSSATGDAAANAAHIRERLQDGLKRLAFFIVPSAAAFMILGDVLVAALYQRGRFTFTDTWITWGILMAASVGLTASAMGRLYSSAFYALRDTRTPLRFAIIRVTLAAIGGWVFATRAPGWVGLPPESGTAALTLWSGIAAAIEFTLLRRKLRGMVGPTGVAAGRMTILWVAALASAGVGLYVKLHILASPVVTAGAVFSAYGATYFAVTALFGVETSTATLNRVRRVVLREGSDRRTS